MSREEGDVRDTQGIVTFPASIGLIPDAPPELQKPLLVECSDTGESTKNAHTKRKNNGDCQKSESSWYVLRTTYGRERKAYEYLKSKGVEAFCPIIETVKLIGGKKVRVEESLLPNIFFAYGTEQELKTYVYDNIRLPYLRFYYRYYHKGVKLLKEPMIVPESQMNSFKIVCSASSRDIVLVPESEPKFKEGQAVRVIGGVFKGVEGRVSRFQGQQRVAVMIDGLLTLATAYVPSAFLENI